MNSGEEKGPNRFIQDPLRGKAILPKIAGHATFLVAAFGDPLAPKIAPMVRRQINDSWESTQAANPNSPCRGRIPRTNQQASSIPNSIPGD